MRRLTRSTFIGLAVAAGLALAPGCGGNATVQEDGAGTGTGTGTSTGTGTGTSTGTGTGTGTRTGTGTGGAPSVWGNVDLVHMQQGGDYPYEQLSLHASFYAEDFDPADLGWGFVETQQTPDGIPCDIYYQSGGMGGEPPPPIPPELGAGHLTAGSAADLLQIDFDGEHYQVDWRTPSDPDHPMPAWLVAGPVTVTFAGAGNSQVPPFDQSAVLPAAPSILAPTPGQSPVPQDPDGTYHIAWQPSEADSTLVQFQFNLDWDNSAFLCHPPAGVTELKLPHLWLTQWTWGSGELVIHSRNAVEILVGAAHVRLRATRLHQMSVYFEVW